MFKATVFFILALCALTYGFPAEVEVNSWRIVGGANASPGEAPYQVSLRSALNSHFCGGVIVSARSVITAAHCIAGRAASNTRVVVGTIFLNSGGTTYTVNTLVSHPSYNPNTIMNDVGIVITSTAIAMGSVVQSIPMSSTVVGGGASALLTGWGTTTYPGSAPNNLQKLTVNTLTVANCQSALQGIGPVSSDQICTFTQAGQGACHGDSGGPLVSGGTVIGLVSWGFPCARGYPDVFARVSSYRTWFINNML